MICKNAFCKRCIVCLITFFTFSFPYLKAQEALTAYVDPFIGTGGHGHTFPGATVPFGMVQLSPDNGISGSDWSSGYHYSATEIAGFSHMHLSGTEKGDWLDISVMPLKQPLAHDEPMQPATFLHSNEQAAPGYYAVKLDNGIMAELTATERVGFHRYSFPAGSRPVIRFDMQFHQNQDIPTETFVKKLNDSTIIGYRYSTGWAPIQRVYFAARTSEKIQEFFLNGEIQIEGGAIELGLKTHEQGKGTIAQLIFAQAENPHVVKLKVALSMTSTEKALVALSEIPHWDFNRVKDEALATWERELAKVQVSTDDKQLKRIFYTALYHTAVAPNLYSDADGTYQNAQGDTLVMESGRQRYTVFALGDTFRALNPLLTVTQPERYTDMLHSMLAFNDEHGLLPVLADAVLKNWPGLDKNRVYEAMKKSASRKNAYDDYCIAQVAKYLGKTEDYRLFIQRSQAYKNVLPRQHTLFVPHDIQGLAHLYGGDELERKLDSLLNGQYAHGNVSSHHIAYMYSFLGKPWKTQKWVRQIIDSMYHDRPDGYAGNEAVGQMSAWAIWNIAGLYPANPVGGAYVMGSPRADAVTFRLKGGKELRIIAENNAAENIYVQSVTYNGRPYDKLYFMHRDLMQGGKIVFKMGSEPNESLGRKPESWPPSVTSPAISNQSDPNQSIGTKTKSIWEQVKEFFNNL